MNRWVLSRLAGAVEQSSRGIREFRLDEGMSALYRFVWDELCDWYLEACKPVFQSGSAEDQLETSTTLAHVIETVLRALHPYAPFVTEELWQRVPRPASRPASLALAPYPESADGRPDPDAERDFDAVMRAIGAARAVRSEHEVHPGAEIPLHLRASPSLGALLSSEGRLISFLVKTQGPPVIEAPGGPRPKGSVLTVAGDVEVLVGLLGLVDADHEQERIGRNLKKLGKDIESLEKRLANASFVEKAPPEVVSEAREQLEGLRRQKARLEEGLALVDELRRSG